MSFDQDQEIASYIVRYILDHQRISTGLLKNKFNVDDLELRKTLIRLYFRGQIFGPITTIDSGTTFIIFTHPDPDNVEIPSIESLIDWDISKFDLETLKQEAINSLPLIHDFDEAETETVYSRSKEKDQKDLISVEMVLDIICEKVSVSINIINSSDLPIINTRLRLNYGEKLKVVGVKPDYKLTIEDSYSWVEIGEIGPNQVKKIIILISQQIFGGFLEIDGILQYKNVEEYNRFIRLEAINIDTSLPSIREGDFDPKLIKAFMKNKDMVKRIQSFGVSAITDINFGMKIMDEVSLDLGFKEISNINKKNIKMTFYFGTSLGPTGDLFEILMVPQIKNDILAIYTCCKYETIVANLIRHFCHKLLELFKAKGHFTEKDEIIDMNCIRCRKVMPIFPPKGELIACSNCKLLQKPW